MTSTNKNKISLRVNGMHCANCVKKVKNALLPFAEEVEITLSPPKATLFNSFAELKELNQALQICGEYSLAIIKEENKLYIEAISRLKHTLSTYKPLILIIIYILTTTTALQIRNGRFDNTLWMRDVMAEFFLIFSFFKLLNIKEFAISFSKYDLLAKKWKGYGYLYPFIELMIGMSYILNLYPAFTNAFTFSIMTFSSLGVFRTLLKREPIKCACLGTFFNLPVSSVTIIEDLLMACMALLMML